MAATDTRAARRRAAKAVAKLSLDQKIALVSGRDFWSTKPMPGIPSMFVTDGPHGLRKQAGDADHIGINDSVPATCFPTAVALASTWDESLLEQVGAALGAECRAEGVSGLLGPGLNIKRNSAGGRAFEYFSEDPVVSGKAAAALVRGIQSQGVAACLKHYAANNQEFYRMRIDTIVDQRTLRELYLRGFEIAVAESQPWTVMSSYNRLNGEHLGESREMLGNVLRGDFGFDGVVMTDWLATFDRVEGLRAGLDLEMPGSGGAWDNAVRRAIDAGDLEVQHLDDACINLAVLAERTTPARAADAPAADHAPHHALARKVAAAATVVLTNDGALPLPATHSVAAIGAFADKPRYQGAGSSLVNPTQLDTTLDALRERLGEDAVTYAPGYDAITGAASDERIAEAVAAARAADVAVVMVGLPASYETEGLDRDHLDMPAGHVALVEAVTAANPRTVVVLVTGSPVVVPESWSPAALLVTHLGGQAGGSGLVDALYGDVEPAGRLAESWPVAAADVPSSRDFSRDPMQVEYREGLHVGYRFHDTFDVAPRFAFGHGLGYTSFAYSGLKATRSGDAVTVTVTVKNTGKRTGSEVVQVYVRDVESSMHRPAQELAAFAKVTLAAGKSQRVELTLDRRAFAVWDSRQGAWRVEGGDFEVRVGSSSRDIRATATVNVPSQDDVSGVTSLPSAWASDDEFAAALRREVPTPDARLPLHRDSALSDLRLTLLGKIVHAAFKRAGGQIAEVGEDDGTQAGFDAMLSELPLRGLVYGSGGKLSFKMLDALLAVLNVFSPIARARQRRG